MLYDPKWETPEVKADPFSLAALIAWLEKRPGTASYDYTCNGHCLLAQYFTAAGFERVEMLTHYFTHGTFKRRLLPKGWNDIAIGRPYGARDPRGARTFGAALARARALAT